LLQQVHLRTEAPLPQVLERVQVPSPGPRWTVREALVRF
jgi:hypothetical protein